MEARELAVVAESEAKRIEFDAKVEAKLIETLGKKEVEYALCLDTLGQNRRFTDEEMMSVKKYAKALQKTLTKIDEEMFKSEYKRREHLTKVNGISKSPDDKLKEIEEMRESHLSEHKGAATEADILFKHRQNTVFNFKFVISEFRSYNVFKGPLAVLQCLLYLLDYTKEEVSDKEGAPDWKKIRGKLNDELFQKLHQYDPRAEQRRTVNTKYAKVKNLRILLKGLSYDDLKTKNLPLAELFGYVTDALEVKKVAKEERKEALRKAKEFEVARLAEEKRLQEEKEKAEKEAAEHSGQPDEEKKHDQQDVDEGEEDDGY